MDSRSGIRGGGYSGAGERDTATASGNETLAARICEDELAGLFQNAIAVLVKSNPSPTFSGQLFPLPSP